MNKWLLYYCALVIFLLLQISCISLSLQKEMQWNVTDKPLVWVSEKQKMKITFPNESWRVYTKPTKVKWVYDENEYTVMHAQIPELDVILRINVTPNVSNDVDYKEYFTFYEQTIKNLIDNIQTGNILEYIPELIQNEKGKTGAITITYKVLLNNVVFNYCEFTVVKKDKEKAVIYRFICREPLFKLKKQQFLDIADSYEYYNPKEFSFGKDND
ncbi:MAG: hypothetical protein JXB49_08055 [Bacteroidales bacterium]|nr:hypothetical protein [Bacteroidales bacterium]